MRIKLQVTYTDEQGNKGTYESVDRVVQVVTELAHRAETMRIDRLTLEFLHDDPK